MESKIKTFAVVIDNEKPDVVFFDGRCMGKNL